MGITCVICEKTQRGWIQDFPLCESNVELRICGSCFDKLCRLTQTATPENESDIIDFFRNASANTSSTEVKKYLDSVLSKVEQLKADNQIKKQQEEIKKQQEETAKKETDKRLNEMLLTTSHFFDGYKVVKYIDVICRESVYKNSFWKRFDASVDDIANSFTLKETEMSGVTALISEAREHTMKHFKIDAAVMGANAILGIQFQSSWGRDVVRVTIAGTAVEIQKISG